MGEWTSLEASADRRELATQLGDAHRHMATSSAWPAAPAGPRGLRPVIARSWQRSLAAGLDPSAGHETEEPYARAELAEVERRRANHPLAVAMPVLDRLIDDAGDHLAIVADADGTILWVRGPGITARWGDPERQMVGLRCAEGIIGTNAIGTAIVERHALQVFAGEHFRSGGHDWCCSGAPVLDPLTGELLGAISINAQLEAAHPHSLSLVTLAARETEQQILLRAQEQARALMFAPDATLVVLGRSRGSLVIGNRRVELSRRHTEFLMLLIACPEGLTAEQLAIEAYGDHGRPGTVRTEMHRLRGQIGALLVERPYRLNGRIDTDIAAVEALIRDGDLEAALGRYGGSALLGTEAPRLVELRDRLDDQLRAAVLASGDEALLRRWVGTPAGQGDIEAARRLE